MAATLQKFGAVLMAMVIFFAAQPRAAAQEHILPLSELQAQMRAAAEQKAKDIEDIQRVLSYPAAAEALRKANVNDQQMRAAVASLSAAELSRLAQQARSSESDVQGGLIVGILALIGLIVVIIIVVSLVAEARPAANPGSFPSAGHCRVEYSAPASQIAAVHG